ncbi:hypothetical protein GCM10009850_021140 [Nonomuraea monospora]|uniref:3-oxoacyl-ACP synthase n=1 Tax=Nonomuraea monospora TaxID=568818 RepID=A0ABN3CBB8_9ACTN
MSGISSFAYVAGDVEGRPEDIPGFDDLWRAVSPDTAFSAMGTGTYRKMTGPLVPYVADCVAKVLSAHGVRPAEVDRLVLATSDGALGLLGRDVAVEVMRAAGLTACVPAVVSLQQCCSSIEALRYGWDLAAAGARNVVLVALDRTPDDRDRVKSFALFGDAVAGCLISRDHGGLTLAGTGLAADFSGMVGQDTFASRQAVARAALDRAYGQAGRAPADVTKIFTSSLYTPIAGFNAMAAGQARGLLHFQEPMTRYGHCGNADWLINLMDYTDKTGLERGALYLAQASAPGFFACALLEAST